jgi:hypothetical protein
MKVFSCNNCQNLIYFENNVCLNCKFPLGFDDSTLSMITLAAGNNGPYEDIKDKNRKFRYCKNAEYSTCNWLIPASQESLYCHACELNRIIPDLTQSQNLKLWKNVESAKHRLVYSLLRLHLPVEKKIGQEEAGIAFDFLAETSPTEKVLTGHDQGIITLNIDEADEAERVKHKEDLGERYRTLLGHFRHEIGHYYWEVLIKDSENLNEYRKIFGDERADYGKALENHYKNGAPADWSENYISSYATSHSWEDWAETWAHYLHLMDTLETAYSFGIDIEPKTDTKVKGTDAKISQNPYEISDFKKIFKSWLPLTFAVNSLSRSMGYADFYPFVIPDPVVRKLQFIHTLCLNQASHPVQKKVMAA